jgi:ribosome maturation factor RimP
VTTLSHKISQSGDETFTPSQIPDMTTLSHKVSHVLDNCSTVGTQNDDLECCSSNMTKNMTTVSHVSKSAECGDSVDSPAQNMTKGSHDLKGLPVNDFSEKVTNMTTFSSDKNVRESANLESMAASSADVNNLILSEKNQPSPTLTKDDRVMLKTTKAEGVVIDSRIYKGQNPKGTKFVVTQYLVEFKDGDRKWLDVDVLVLTQKSQKLGE